MGGVIETRWLDPGLLGSNFVRRIKRMKTYLLLGTDDAPATTGLSEDECALLFTIPQEESDLEAMFASTTGVLFATRESIDLIGMPPDKKATRSKPAAEVVPIEDRANEWVICGREAFTRGCFVTDPTIYRSLYDDAHPPKPLGELGATEINEEDPLS